MPRDSAATRDRIVAAATAEFAAHGIAGARVDRIADKAAANKAQLYAYFGNKEQLFDTVYARAVDEFLATYSMRPEDLPGTAVELYDAWLARPDMVRLQTWARLERRPDGELLEPDVATRAYRLADVKAEQRAGRVRSDLQPIDVVAMVLAVSLAWAPTSQTIVAAVDDSSREHRRRKRALRDAVTAMLAPR